MEPYVTVKTKSPTSDERWEGSGLLSGGAAHLIRPAFWGEGNGPMTSGIRAQNWMGENVTIKTKSSTSDKRWKGPGLISGAVVHPIRLVFWETVMAL